MSNKYYLLLKLFRVIQKNLPLLKGLANSSNKKMYQHEAKDDWDWAENYLTYKKTAYCRKLYCARRFQQWTWGKNGNINQGAKSTVSYLMARLCFTYYWDLIFLVDRNFNYKKYLMKMGFAIPV
ncbi:hypothetical protein ACFOEQ_07245 [Chryseobacterium arachidis]|uniref:hypothetical protein n=1 Tax=Chryseobacterium arachidis TaxID=1416778 RepID=UPI0036090499